MTDVDKLRAVVEEHVGGKAGVEAKTMFGCDAFFKKGAIFALIWKEGRIGVKLPDAEARDELNAVKGTAPWSPGGKMAMKAWVLVPVSWHKGGPALAGWLDRAYAQAEAKPKTVKKKAAKKKKT